MSNRANLEGKYEDSSYNAISYSLWMTMHAAKLSMAEWSVETQMNVANAATRPPSSASCNNLWSLLMGWYGRPLRLTSVQQLGKQKEGAFSDNPS